MSVKIQLTSRKAKKYPVKTNMNLLVRPDTSAWLPNFVVYGLLVVVLLTALLKVAVYDILIDLNAERQKVINLQYELLKQNAGLSGYDEAMRLYERYSYGYLSEDETGLVDRTDMLEMLDRCIGARGIISSVKIQGNMINTSYYAANLDAASDIVLRLNREEIVKSVSVSTASTGEKGSMDNGMLIIDLIIETELVSGEGDSG